MNRLVWGAAGVPADAYVGLVLMAIALIGAIVMTTIVIARNRRQADAEYRRRPIERREQLPPHPG